MAARTRKRGGLALLALFLLLVPACLSGCGAGEGGGILGGLAGGAAAGDAETGNALAEGAGEALDGGEASEEGGGPLGQDGEYVVVGFSQVGSESDWRLANTESFRSTFTTENGYYLIFEDGQQKQENQIKAIRNFILQEVDYIVLDPIVETGWDAVFQEARDAGIPLILSDRTVDVEDDGLYTCWVGSDFQAEGRRAGEWLRRYLEGEGREDEPIRIAYLQGTLGSSAQIGRTRGFQEVLSEQENWELLDQKSGDFVQARGQEVMEEFLASYEDIDVVVSENDNMTFGAIDAIHRAGKTCGPGGDMILISFDAVSAALEAMRRGEIHADFECNPLVAPKVAEIIQKLERGEAVAKRQFVPETYFDTAMDLGQILRERTY